MAGRKLIHITTLNKVRIQTVLFIALFWTAIDYVIVIMRPEAQPHVNSIFFREILMLVVSLVMAYFFVYRLKGSLKKFPYG